jgi:hypothetical protein
MRSLKHIYIIAILGCMILQGDVGACAEEPIGPAGSPKKLISMTNYDFSVLTAEIVSATDSMPEYCDVRGVIPSEIKFAVKLPTNWNGRFYMVGNGGYAGEIDLESMKVGLIEGYATASTDTGHDSSQEPLATFAYNNRLKEIDYAFRAVHLTAITAKKIIEAYYGKKPVYSYWMGCSTGGRQALMEAQRFPDDFDGIIVGAPEINFAYTIISFIWNAKALLSANIGQGKLKILANAVYDKCDGKDGLKDGLIEDTLKCDFDPGMDLPMCSGDIDGSECFTKAQIAALKNIYGGVKDSKGNLLFPGQPLGAEAFTKSGILGGEIGSGWEPWIIGNPSIILPEAAANTSVELLFGETFMKYMAFEKDDPNYDWKTFNFDTDPQKMTYIQLILDATNPNLSDFKARGGKIIHYHGWADPILNPLMSINYYNGVLKLMGKETSKFYRLYMVPGMFHCSDGVGCDEVDWFTPLVNWVEKGIAPEELIGSHSTEGKTNRTRPICPYPKVSEYKGTGDINNAANFFCAEP